MRVIRIMRKFPLFLFLISFAVACRPAPVYDIGSTRVSEIDGMTMVFVPGGEFTMGSNDGPTDEQPVHSVEVDGVWIDRTEVTNAMFAQFVEQTGHVTDAEQGGCSFAIDLPTETWNCLANTTWLHPQGPASSIEGLGSHPVVQVSWNDATAYCEWAGRRLPTEAEWEKAARGADARTFPWGNDPVAGELLNMADVTYGTAWAVTDIDDGHAFTSPVGNYPGGASPYGALDLAANVWEWSSSQYQPYPYDVKDGREDPDPNGTYVLRGGSWDDFTINVRTTIRFRGAATFRVSYIGFRCAQSP
jgi:formylglycine-generating enzyme required for sulfatase activity